MTENEFLILTFFLGKKMQVYTKQSLYDAYKVGALEIATKIQKDLYESAKYFPDYFEYTEKIFGNRRVLEEVLRLLIGAFPGISVTMEYTPEDSGQGMAVFKIDWS